MCGIFGSYSLHPAPSHNKRLEKALRELHHRGPNDHGLESFSIGEGQLALGHTRLSIIDLSPGGHQPMHSTDGRHTIVFNGEIYNYRELRQELKSLGHVFLTESDTEVLLAAWSQWDTEALQRLIGMFAFAMFDRKDRTLTLARDAFGIKPLFYGLTAKGFVFASEIPVILGLREMSMHLNPQRAYDYLIHGVQDMGFETFVEGVNHLPPAHWVQIDLDDPEQSRTERWWDPNLAQTSELSFAEAAEHLRELFLDSVRLHLRSDVPLGVALSGGIDSSAIACGARYLEPDIDLHTFSFIGEHGSQSEEPWIDIVNSKINAVSHKVYIETNDLERDIDELMTTQGEPFGGTAMYAQWRIFQCAREAGITVVLEGQGGDEVLGGYSGYPGQLMLSYLEAASLKSLWRFSRHFHDWEGREDLNPWRALIGQLIPDTAYNYGNRLLKRSPMPNWLNQDQILKSGINVRPIRMEKKAVNRRRRLVETLFQSLTIQGLPHLLRYGDRNAMHFSIENRVPFLTLPIAEFMLSQPESYLVSEYGETKSLFRAAMQDIVPEEILNRRDKIGFHTPMREWMRHRILTDLNDTDERPDSVAELINQIQMKQFVKQAFESDTSFSWQVWRIFNLLHWSKHIQKG